MLGDIIGAVGKIVGGFMDRSTAKDQQAAQERNAANNIALQREFAQSGIQWKVADAKAAGIHPLFALGANTHSFSPVSLGSTSSPSMADTLGGAGQDISRAINATRTSAQRDAAFVSTARSLELAGKQLDNDLKATTLASSVQRLKQQSNPPIPQGDSEKRPPLWFGGGEWKTDPMTSNMEDWEKRYGDDGPASWMIPPMIGWQDYKANHGEPAGISGYVMRAKNWADRALNRGSNIWDYWK